MRVKSGTNKPEAFPTGKRTVVTKKAVTLPSTKVHINAKKGVAQLVAKNLKKAAPLMDDSELDMYKGALINRTFLKQVSDLEEVLGKTTASPAELNTLSKEVAKAAELGQTIENLEAMLKEQKKDLHKLTTQTIPDIMRAAHTTLHKTDKGVSVELKDFMNGSLPKEPSARAKALAWLDKNGAKDLIKTHFDLALGRGQKDSAEKVRKALNKMGMTYNEEESVHAQSLYGWARERMKMGKALPIDLLGLYVGQVAKIEMPDKETQRAG